MPDPRRGKIWPVIAALLIPLGLMLLLATCITSGASITVAANDSSPLSRMAADFVCDGVDDQIEIQDAFTAAGRGGTVLLLEGTFRLRGDLIVPSDIVLEGRGPEVTHLQWSSGYMHVNSQRNVTVRNFKTTGTGALFFMNSNHITVHNITATVDSSSWGGAFQLWVTNGVMEDIEFVNCKAIDCGRFGFMNDGEGTQKLIRNIRYIDCQAINSGRYSRLVDYHWVTGFDFAENNDLEDCQVIRCIADGSWESGFHIEEDPKIRRMIMRDCIARNNGQKPDTFYNYDEDTYGAHFGAGYLIQGDVDLVNCVAEGNQNAGYACGPGVRLLRCSDTGSEVGFRLVDTRTVVLEDCQSRDAQMYAVYAMQARDITVRNFSMIDPAGNGEQCTILGSAAFPVVNSTFDISSSGGGCPKILACRGCRDVTLSGRLETILQDPVIITGSENVDTKGLQIRPPSDQSP